jgi:ATP synthase subunit 6
VGLYNVFESFNIIYIPNICLSFILGNTACAYVLQCTFLISLILYYSLQHMSISALVEPSISIVFRNFYSFIYSIIYQQLNIMRTELVPHVFTISLFIWFGNVCGLVPYGFSITSFPGVTLVLSSIVFFSCLFLALLIPIYNVYNFMSFYKVRYLYFLSFFAPHDVPTWLYPLVISIEVISFFFRLVSLGFRLAANLMAGHILLGLLASAYCGLLLSIGSSLIILLLFSVVICGLILFELFVSFLQTYVFIVLLCSYYNDIYSHFDART